MTTPAAVSSSANWRDDRGPTRPRKSSRSCAVVSAAKRITATPRKCKAPVRLGVPRRPGAHAFVVDVYINGRHVRRLRRHIVGHVILAHPPRRAFRATLIAHYNRPYRGARATSHWTFPACSR